AGDARAAEPAVTVRVPCEVLLVVVLGVVEGAGFRDLGRDRAVTRAGESLLEAVARAERRVALGLARPVDGGAVLRADVVPLTHALGRVVAFPEDAEELVVRGLIAMEDGQHDLGVAGAAAACLLVRRVVRDAARIADRCRVHARRLPEEPLRAPE